MNPYFGSSTHIKHLARDVKLDLLLGCLLGEEVLEDRDCGDVVRLEECLAT